VNGASHHDKLMIRCSETLMVPSLLMGSLQDCSINLDIHVALLVTGTSCH